MHRVRQRTSRCTTKAECRAQADSATSLPTRYSLFVYSFRRESAGAKRLSARASSAANCLGAATVRVSALGWRPGRSLIDLTYGPQVIRQMHGVREGNRHRLTVPGARRL